MRHIKRRPLADKVVGYLERKQLEVDGGADARRTWSAARRTKSLREVERTLKAMAGAGRRCMFCEDSRGADMDHFWPMSRYPGRTFSWPNLLWVCAVCNRLKGDQLELGPGGRPLLIDPTSDQPWQFLFYDSATDRVVARFDAKRGRYDRRGEYTAREDVLPLNDEAVTNGRGRTRRNLARAVREFLGSVEQRGESEAAVATLREALRDNDAYGLLPWYFCFEGQQEEPFRTLEQQAPHLFAALRSEVEAAM